MSPDELRKWRNDRDYTQSELSKGLGIHRITLAKYETGAIAIPEILALALAGLDAMGGDAIPRERKRKRRRKGGEA